MGSAWDNKLDNKNRKVASNFPLTLLGHQKYLQILDPLDQNNKPTFKCKICKEYLPNKFKAREHLEVAHSLIFEHKCFICGAITGPSFENKGMFIILCTDEMNVKYS